MRSKIDEMPSARGQSTHAARHRSIAALLPVVEISAHTSARLMHRSGLPCGGSDRNLRGCGTDTGSTEGKR